MTALEIVRVVERCDPNDPPVDVLLLQLLRDEGRSWTTLAACRGVNPDLFFPIRGQTTEPAKAVCARCVVREECLEDAMVTKTKFGIWGGTSERERRRIRRSARAETTGRL